MAVKVHLHLTLRQFTNGQEIIDVDGTTVGECLKNVVKKYPGMESSLFGKNGKLSNIVEIYVNLQSAYPNELAKQVKDGDEIHVTMMLAGG
ncbi:MAG: MoaD/ThiS family protein [Deltaproteobacteria bacterium]|jgi:molybdopterin converting factor small subunit|nr:MoaD/ThiS family protein [Deltaproteobacteria bacterium]